MEKVNIGEFTNGQRRIKLDITMTNAAGKEELSWL
jgi:hypothetical protein